MSDTTKTPRTDELCRDHYYEASAESAGMVVSAKSPEDCYREAIDLARQLERELGHSASVWKAAMEEREWWENKAKSYRKLLPHSFEEH